MEYTRPTLLIMETELFYEVSRDKRLLEGSKWLFMLLKNICDKNGCCSPSDEFLAKPRYSVRTIKRCLKNLKDNGYIDTEIIYKEGTKEVDKRIIRVKK